MPAQGRWLLFSSCLYAFSNFPPSGHSLKLEYESTIICTRLNVILSGFHRSDNNQTDTAFRKFYNSGSTGQTSTKTDSSLRNSDRDSSSPKNQGLFLEPVEITAIRAGDKSPFTKMNINAGQIAKTNNGQDLPYILDQTPSVVVGSDAGNGIGYTNISIR